MEKAVIRKWILNCMCSLKSSFNRKHMIAHFYHQPSEVWTNLFCVLTDRCRLKCFYVNHTHKSLPTICNVDDLKMEWKHKDVCGGKNTCYIIFLCFLSPQTYRAFMPIWANSSVKLLVCNSLLSNIPITLKFIGIEKTIFHSHSSTFHTLFY